MSQAADLTVTVEPLGPEPPSGPPPTRSRRRRRRWLIALVAVVAGLVASGGATSVLVWYSIDLQPPVAQPESTALYYADGTLLGHLGTVQRTVVPYEEILPAVIDVAVAAEDPDFWSNRGGPITRTVVRNTQDLVDTGLNSRLRLWVLAHKLEAAHSKEQILEQYLNAVPFGRNTYGIEAAARAYFGKSASTTAPPNERLTTAEAMVLLAMVRQPYADPADPEGSPGFDPLAGAAAEANSRQRWTEIRDALAELARSGRARAVAEAEVSGLSYPELRPTGPGGVFDDPVGLVANHILSELAYTPGSPFEGWTFDAIRNGGFSITTTIDKRVQKVLLIAADGTSEQSPMFGQPLNLQAAAVVVQPGTGRVLAYYGGPDPLGMDFAGVHRGEDGQLVGFGAHPPGGSFMVYTLAAALRAGHSLDSWWQWTPHVQEGRDPANLIRNTSTCPTSPDGRLCTLRDSLVYSLNVPFYEVTTTVGVPAVLTMARDLGITALWTDERVRVDLTTADLTAPEGSFGYEVGLGQNPVTVLDQAAAMATLAGGGVPTPAHFVREVRKGDEVLYVEPAPGDAVLAPDQVADLTDALTAASGTEGLAIKTGAWEYAAGLGNTDAWSIGYTSDLAIAVWVGNGHEVQPLIDKDGAMIWGSGLPTRILRQVVDETRGLLGERA
jgi:membrane peptidoglycan carboxypeptidase